MVFQHDFILSQGAGFIRAQDVHRAKVLNRVEVLHNDFLFRQLHRPACQGRGDNHGQHLRRQAHRHRQGKQRRFPPVAFGVAVDQQHHRRHHQHKADQQHADAADAFLEGIGFALLLAYPPGQLAKPGVAAGGEDHRLRRSAHHVGAHKAQGIALKRVALLRVAAARHFFDRQRFTGQRRLGHEQIPRLKNTQVCRDHIPGRQLHDIARHQPINRQFAPAAFALFVDHPQHRRGVADHRLQRIRRFGRAGFLNEIEQRGDPHHQRNHAGSKQVFRRIRDDTQHGQQQVERVAVAGPEVHPPRRRFLCRNLVIAVAGNFPRNVGVVKPFRVAFEGAPDFIFVHRRHVQAVLTQRIRNRRGGQIAGIR